LDIVFHNTILHFDVTHGVPPQWLLPTSAIPALPSCDWLWKSTSGTSHCTAAKQHDCFQVLHAWLHAVAQLLLGRYILHQEDCVWRYSTGIDVGEQEKTPSLLQSYILPTTTAPPIALHCLTSLNSHVNMCSSGDSGVHYV
jgi:hypothetical protein